MTKEQKPLFEILNNFWNLIKPYASKEDEKIYKQIMSDYFRMLIKDRGVKYTDEWWNTTKDILNYPEKFRNTKYVDFAAELAIGIVDYWNYDSHNKATYYNFMTFTGRAFLNEWGRLRNAKET